MDNRTNSEVDAGLYEDHESGMGRREWAESQGYEPDPNVPPRSVHATGPLMDALNRSIAHSRTLPHNPNRPAGAPLAQAQFVPDTLFKDVPHTEQMSIVSEAARAGLESGKDKPLPKTKGTR